MTIKANVTLLNLTIKAALTADNTISFNKKYNDLAVHNEDENIKALTLPALTVDDDIQRLVYARAAQFGGMLGDMDIAVEQTPLRFSSRVGKGSMVAHTESDGTTPWADTNTASVVIRYPTYSQASFHYKAVVTDELAADATADVVGDFTVTQMAEDYHEKYGNELIQGTQWTGVKDLYDAVESIKPIIAPIPADAKPDTVLPAVMMDLAGSTANAIMDRIIVMINTLPSRYHPSAKLYLHRDIKAIVQGLQFTANYDLADDVKAIVNNAVLDDFMDTDTSATGSLLMAFGVPNDTFRLSAKTGYPVVTDLYSVDGCSVAKQSVHMNIAFKNDTSLILGVQS